MKKILVLLFSVILTLSIFTVAGCGSANSIVENSLEYDINTSTYLYYDDIDGSFDIKVNSGIVTKVKFTVKGYDKDGNELWKENIYKSYKGLEAQDKPYNITFYCSYYVGYDSNSTRTNSITVTGVELINENSIEWMGWTFVAVSAVVTFAVIALFVVSKLKSTSETSSENPES